jgi:hypothetical protein
MLNFDISLCLKGSEFEDISDEIYVAFWTAIDNRDVYEVFRKEAINLLGSSEIEKVFVCNWYRASLPLKCYNSIKHFSAEHCKKKVIHVVLHGRADLDSQRVDRLIRYRAAEIRSHKHLMIVACPFDIFDRPKVNRIVFRDYQRRYSALGVCNFFLFDEQFKTIEEDVSKKCYFEEDGCLNEFGLQCYCEALKAKIKEASFSLIDSSLNWICETPISQFNVINM